MNPAWRHMALAVFDKQNVDQISIEEIDQVIDKYPYFAVLHYIRTGKLLADEDQKADSSAAKTALFFWNPHWFNQQLIRHGKAAEEHQPAMAEIMTTHTDPELLTTEGEAVSETELKREELDADYDNKRIFEEHEADDTGEYQAEEFDVTTTQEEVEPQTIAHEELITTTTQEEVAPQNFVKEDTSVVAENLLGLGPVQPVTNEQEDVLIPIEPLYTIDYFASQGIKLPVEEAPGDQLAVKLKSFTEWLKSMKRLQPEKLDKQLDQETEKQIRQTAEHSNENKDLFTEALAEVYLKQGLDDKAVEVYKKLSLLDPSKSAYFAARIRDIKEI